MKKLIAIGLIATALAGVGATANTASAHTYPPGIRAQFMRGCVGPNSNMIFCGCSWNWLTAHVSHEQFTWATNAQINRWATRAFRSCSILL